MSKVLLQINVTANWGSTGKIAEQINLLANKQGWETYIAYGRNNNPSQSKLFRVGNTFQVYEHFAESVLADNDGLASRIATSRLNEQIKTIKPDIIHLHNIHDHWLNYRTLFNYLNTLDIPIVWTQHDCWSFTGDCGYFSVQGCEQWKEGCTATCPYRKGSLARKLVNHTEQHYKLKKELFTSTKNLTLVPVSRWLEGVLRQSFLKDKPIKTILNGVDVNVFKPIDDAKGTLRKYGIEGVRYVVGVATTWSERKGFKDYCQLTSLMPEGVKIVLVGLNEKQQQEAERFGIIGIPRTENVGELVALYNGASIVINLSYEETFGLTTVEGFACGTPSIVYNATASPELVTHETGIVCEPGDIDGVADAVRTLLAKENLVDACRKRAVEFYDKNDRYREYVELYEELIKRRERN